VVVLEGGDLVTPAYREPNSIPGCESFGKDGKTDKPRCTCELGVG
jgi:hypothetical protein